MRQTLRKELAVAGFVIRQAQAARQLMRNFRQRRFNLTKLAGFQQLVRYAGIFQHGDIAGGILVLLLGAEQLQRPALAAFVLNPRRRAQRFQTVAAVFRQAHHAPFVLHVVAGVAVAQHLPHPLQLELRAVKADGQRRVALEHPFNRFQRNARRSPRRRIPRRDLPGVRRAGFKRGTGFTIDNGYVMSRLT